MKEKTEVLTSLESIIREITTVAEENGKNEDLAEVLPDLPAAVERFKRGENNVTFKLLRGSLLALACYDVDMPKSGMKKESMRISRKNWLRHDHSNWAALR